MRQDSSALRGFRPLLLLTLVLGLTLGLTAVAQAQETSADEEYGNQADPGLRAIEDAFASSDNGGSLATHWSQDSNNSAGAPDTTDVLSSGVLPLTGGSLLPVIALGVLALSAIGLIAVRRTNPSEVVTSRARDRGA